LAWVLTIVSQGLTSAIATSVDLQGVALERHSTHAQSLSPRQFPCESFVDADVAAEFLMVKRKTILDWARSGVIPAHPFGRGKRVVWRFRISEIARSDRETPGHNGSGSPAIARTEKRNG
jgi:excisionase family DNA binding protein